MRVKHIQHSPYIENAGITPAHAGKTVTVKIMIMTAWDHPRACG